MLFVWLNSDWLARHGQPAADNVINFIATWNLAGGRRRDNRVPGLVFQFADPGDIVRCRGALKVAFPDAFAYSQTEIAHVCLFLYVMIELSVHSFMYRSEAVSIRLTYSVSTMGSIVTKMSLSDNLEKEYHCLAPKLWRASRCCPDVESDAVCKSRNCQQNNDR